MFYHSNEISTYRNDDNLISYFSSQTLDKVRGIFEYLSWMFTDRSTLILNYQNKKYINPPIFSVNKNENPLISISEGHLTNNFVSGQHGILPNVKDVKKMIKKESSIKRSFLTSYKYSENRGDGLKKS